MSEKIDPEVEMKTDSMADDDPLAELARIVAGEIEPALETATQDHEPQHEILEPELPDAAPEADESVAQVANVSVNIPDAGEEAPLQYSPDAEPAPVTHPDMPEPAQEITRAVDAVAQGTPEHNDPAEGETVSSDTQEYGFEDELMNALGADMPGVADTRVQESVEVIEPSEVSGQQEIPMENPPVSDLEAFESQLTAELEAAPQPASPVFPPETTSVHVDQVPETQTVPEAQAVPETLETPEAQDATDLEGDLGAAFVQEFEQMLANEPVAPAQEIVEETSISAEPTHIQADSAEQLVPAPTAQTALPADSSDSAAENLDFGSAFAKELGVEKVEEYEGWSEDDSEAANAEFSDAVQPGAENEYQADPGHVETVTELDFEDNFVANEQPEQNAGSLKYAIAALVIALFAGTIIAGYGFLGSDDGATASTDPRIIKADSEPVKVKPVDPGGKVVANQDKASYERVSGEDSEAIDQESLISNTEEPAKIEVPKVEEAEIETATSLTEKFDDRLASSDNENGDTAVQESSSVAPRVVKTVSVKPDGTIVQVAPSVPEIDEAVSDNAVELASNAIGGLRESQSSLTETLAATAKPVETQTIVKPQPIDGARSTGNTAVPEASPLPKPVVKAKPKPAKPKPVQTAAVQAEEPAATTPVRKSEWVVQVSSQRSPEAAQASYQNLRNRFGILKGRPMSIQRANVNGSTFYRVRLQTSSRADANKLCTDLKAAGGSCFVSR